MHRCITCTILCVCQRVSGSVHGLSELVSECQWVGGYHELVGGCEVSEWVGVR